MGVNKMTDQQADAASANIDEYIAYAKQDLKELEDAREKIRAPHLQS